MASSIRCFKFVVLFAIFALVTAADSSPSEEDTCAEDFCHAVLDNDTEEMQKSKRHLCEEECEEELDTEIHVANLNYEYVQSAFGTALLIMVVVTAKLWWHSPVMEPIARNIPESCMLIVLGTFFGGIITSIVKINDADSEPVFNFTPDLFFLVLLPPIVLDAGYFLDIRSFFENFLTISIYAVIGTLWNAFAIGAMLFLFSELNLMDSDLTLSAALLLGTIVSAVDPVAVLAVFDEIHVNRLLHVLVFGESLLNDAVTVVLFRLFSIFANRQFLSRNLDQIEDLLEPSCHGQAYHDFTKDDFIITVSDVFLGFAHFVVVIVCSIVLGCLFGAITSFITKYTEHVHVLEPMIVVTMGYLAYVVGEMFELSGIITLISAAIVMRHYVEANLSRKSHTTLKYALKVVSIVSEMVIFLFLGLSLYDPTQLEWDTGMVLWTLLFAAVFRPIGIIALTYVVNKMRVHKVGYKEQFVMSYSGLRGAVAFALALIWRTEEGLDCFESNIEEIGLRRRMLTTVTTVVMFTVFVQGTTIKPIVERMKVKRSNPGKPTMNEEIHTSVMDNVLAGLEDIIGHFGDNRLRYKFQNLDVKYMRKLFERKAESREEQILQTFHRLQYIDSVAAVEKNMIFEAKGGAKGPVQIYDVTTLSPVAGDEFDEGEAVELPPLQDIINYNYHHPHRDHMKHQIASDDKSHRREHLHFRRPSDVRNINVYDAPVHVKRHAHHKSKTRTEVKEVDTVNHASTLQVPEVDEVSITSDHEIPLFATLTNEGASIESVNDIPLFPDVTYEEQTDSPIFRTASPESEMPMISVHYELPGDKEIQLNSMETAV